MTNTELLELAARVEASEGADRNLDADIGRAVGVPALQCDYNPPSFTTSLDAAMSLVPANPEWEGGAAAFLLDFEAGTCLADFSCFARDRGEERLLMVRAATAPLALTAACLKAHALRACAAQPTPSVQEQEEK